MSMQLLVVVLFFGLCMADDGLARNELYPEETGNYFEGDIKLFPEQEAHISRKFRRRVKRKFVRRSVLRWKNTKIPYAFSKTPRDESELDSIRNGLKLWEADTCLRFIEKDTIKNNENIIVFTNDDGCSSNIGREPLQMPQFVSLANECMNSGVIVHEIAHALGFWHEQSRSDRDKYVSVLWRNIKPTFMKQFTKERLGDVDSADLDYDYGSVMHYRGVAYQRNKSELTIKANLPAYQETIGQRHGLAFNDIKLMNMMYCNHICESSHSSIECEHGGYPNPTNILGSRCGKCKCPKGFHGNRCQHVRSNRVCGGTLRAIRTMRSIRVDKRNPRVSSIQRGRKCYWLIKSEPNTFVQVIVKRPFWFAPVDNSTPCNDYVEINNSTNFGNTGMRWCGKAPPEVSHVVSVTNEMFIKVNVNEMTARLAVVYRQVGPRGYWSKWSSWTDCTAPCGGCGTRVRYRTCTVGFGCSGERVQSSQCNNHICQFCLRLTDQLKACMISGEDCSWIERESTVCLPENQCCKGFHPVGDTCQADEF